MVLSDSAWVEQSENVLAEELDDEVVILDLVEGYYFGLTGPGRDMWRICESGASFGDIKRKISDRYEVSEPQVAKDLLNLLSKLGEKNLVRIKE